jgi:hypothetical protein
MHTDRMVMSLAYFFSLGRKAANKSLLASNIYIVLSVKFNISFC